jgi:alcohol dehydrogenase (cytochrome c)
MAISMRTAKTIWTQKAADYKDGYSMTHAPLIAGGVLITGISGGEYGSRGFLDGWDLKTGEKKWHRWTTAAPGEPGGDTWKPDAYKTGGAPTWLTGTYDPELGPRLLGHRQRRPVERRHARRRLALHRLGAGDQAVDRSDRLALPVLARRSIRLRRHERARPGRAANLPGAPGKTTKVLMQANRNGFFYVIDRTAAA